MANFTTHIAVGTLVSGALATLTLAADIVEPQSLVAVTLAGVIGSILPDIDLKDSRPSRALFAGLAVFFSFAVLFNAAPHYSIAELWIVWLGTLLGVRYGLHAIFHAIAEHRGVWHSLLALVFCSLVGALFFKYLLGASDGIAWLGAAFLGLGFLTHLVLDEVYSVDVMDTRIKASFGTAVKLADFKDWQGSAAMLVGAVGLAVMAPPPGDFLSRVTSPRVWAGLQQRLLPADNRWFGVVDVTRLTGMATGAGPTENAGPDTAPSSAPVRPSSAITTGSLPDRARPATSPDATPAASEAPTAAQ